MGKTITFQRPDGGTTSGYLAEPPASATAPGLVVLQEWWGLNDQVRASAERFAAAGFRALVPDLYRGQSTLDAKEAEHLMTGLDFADAAGQDVRGALAWLKVSGSRKCGVTGFCMGGALTVLAAVLAPETDAAVSWYGYPPLEFVDAGRIRAPIMGHWGLHDEFFAIAGVDALEARLKEAGVRYEFHRYDAGHAFANETQVGENRLLPVLEYQPEAAALAWQRTLEFLKRELAA